MKSALTANIAEGVGGPSAVAVFSEAQLPQDPAEQISALQDALGTLKTLGHGVSKCAVISPLSDEDRMSFQSVQVQEIDEGDGRPRLETGKDCGNSMVGSTLVAHHAKYGAEAGPGRIVHIRNRDTAFAATMRMVHSSGSSEASFDMDVTSVVGRTPHESLLADAPTWKVYTEEGSAPVSTLSIVNPYIVVPANELGVDDPTLLLQPNPGISILNRLHVLRKAVAETLAYPPTSEFPKIAIAHRSGSTIVARTVYRSGWHPGLPITASISLAIASRIPGSVLDAESQSERNQDTLNIVTPREATPLQLSVNSDDGKVAACILKNRKAVMRLGDIRCRK